MIIDEIWAALDKGQLVNWCNSLYKVHPVDFPVNKHSALSHRDGQALRVTCISNHFGGLIELSDLDNCYIRS